MVRGLHLDLDLGMQLSVNSLKVYSMACVLLFARWSQVKSRGASGLWSGVKPQQRGPSSLVFLSVYRAGTPSCRRAFGC